MDFIFSAITILHPAPKSEIPLSLDMPLFTISFLFTFFRPSADMDEKSIYIDHSCFQNDCEGNY